MDPSYNRNSNITAVVDNIHVDGSSNGLYDTAYTLDNLNRLTNAQWGDWDGITFTNEQREKIWTLTQTGNWDMVQLDLDNDGVYDSGTGEYLDDRIHNVVNELTTRDIYDDASVVYNLAYDDLGELTDDGENYIYKYDAFGRLIEISTTGGSPALVSEYRYNGLGHRISWHYDVDADGTVEDTSDDPPFYFAYNESWQQVATYRDDDTSPKEQFVYHNAGLGGYGGSSAIDGVINRDFDKNSGWASAADGTLEDRIYYCQNWRGDVSVIVTDLGTMVEWVKYTAYGIPFGIPLGDTDSNGLLNVLDYIAILTYGGGYDVRYDLNLDGVIDGTDATLANSASPITLGFGALSDPGVGNRKGYAGYEHAPELANSMWHVRNRVMISELLGRWITRDPIGYGAGANLYAYVASNPIKYIDSLGLAPGEGGPPSGGSPQGGGGRRPLMDPIYPPGYGLKLCAGGGRRPPVIGGPCGTFPLPLVGGGGRRPPIDPINPPGSGGGAEPPGWGNELPPWAEPGYVRPVPQEPLLPRPWVPFAVPSECDPWFEPAECNEGTAALVLTGCASTGPVAPLVAGGAAIVLVGGACANLINWGSVLDQILSRPPAFPRAKPKPPKKKPNTKWRCAPCPPIMPFIHPDGRTLTCSNCSNLSQTPPCRCRCQCSDGIFRTFPGIPIPG